MAMQGKCVSFYSSGSFPKHLVGPHLLPEINYAGTLSKSFKEVIGMHSERVKAK